MTQIENVKKYLKKLKNTINMHHEYKFFGKVFVKKTYIDDILCCFIAMLPNTYKQVLEIKIVQEQENLASIKEYLELMSCIKKTFFLDSKVYMINLKKTNKLIKSLIINIEKDLKQMQNKKII